MSGSTVKAKAREIRRAFGPQAASVLDIHEQAFSLVQADIMAEVGARKDADAELYEATNRDRGVCNVRFDEIELDLLALKLHGDTLWTRMRWLFTGK